MSTDDVETKIASDGLRYKAKVSGSPFGAASHANGTMSCMKCGLHKLRSKGSFKRYLNTNLFFCGECKPIKQNPA